MKILAAMNAVQTALAADGIGKGRRNQQQGYNFRGIDDMYNVVGPLLAEHKIIPVPHYSDVTRELRENKEGRPIFVTHVLGRFDLISAEDGSKLEGFGPFPGEAMDSADKSTNKAMSASFKYALMQIFTIPTEGDNDADATTHEPAARKQNSKAGAGQEPTGSKDPESAPASDATIGKRGPSDGHPLMLQLEALLSKYGDTRPKFEKLTAEAFNVATIYLIPPAVLPQALLRVQEHQKAARSAKGKTKNETPKDTPPAGNAGDDGIPV